MIRLSASAIAAWRACQRRHHYGYDRYIRPVQEKESLRIGTNWHALHETLWEVDEKYLVGTMWDYLDKCYEIYPAWISPSMWETEKHTLATAYQAYREYFTEPQDVVSVEEKYELPLINPGTSKRIQDCVLVAKIDKIIKSGPRLAIKEYKTTSKSLTTSDYWDNLGTKIQSRLYMYMAHRLVEEGILPDDMFISEVEYDVFSKPNIKPKPPTKKELTIMDDTAEYYGETLGPDYWNIDFETPQMFAARLAADMRATPEKYFARRSIGVSISDLDGIEIELYHLYRQMRYVKTHGLWDANPDSCITPFKCQYCSLCFNGWTEDMDLPSDFTDERTK